jgi:hypothetical protein
LHFGFCWFLLPSFGGERGAKMPEDFVAGPRIHFGRKWTTIDDESRLNLTVILHGTTQTRCIILPKVADNALISLHNIFCPFFRS